jgi:hypothetical protein
MKKRDFVYLCLSLIALIGAIVFYFSRNSITVYDQAIVEFREVLREEGKIRDILRGKTRNEKLLVAYFNYPCESCPEFEVIRILKSSKNVKVVLLLHPDNNKNDIENLRSAFDLEFPVIALDVIHRDRIESSEINRAYDGLVFVFENESEIALELHPSREGDLKKLNSLSS